MKWKLSSVLAGALAVTGVAFAQDDAPKTPVLKADIKAAKKEGEKEAPPKKLPEIPLTVEPAPAPVAAAPVAPVLESVVSEQIMPRPPRFSFRSEYLHWSVHRAFIPPLVTTSASAVDANGNANTGVLNQPDTQILFGADKLPFDLSPGFRGHARFGLSPDSSIALEIGGFFLSQQTTDFSISNSNTPLEFYTRPFFDVFNNKDSGFDVSVKRDALSGVFSLHGTHRLWGFEANISNTPWERSNQLRFGNFFFGYRSVTLHESLSIGEDLSPNKADVVFFPKLPNDPNPDPTVSVNPGERVVITDYFATSNRFHGVQLGTDIHWEAYRFSFDILAKIAAGINIQSATIAGTSTLIAANGVERTVEGGVLALTSNSGSPNTSRQFRRNEFALVPELGFRAGYDLTNRLRLHVGYDVLFISSVARAGSQINNFLDIRQVPTDPNFGLNLVDQNGKTVTANEPRFLFRDDAYWAHGVNFGMEWRY